MQALDANAGVTKIAEETEVTLRFAVFLLTLHYFRVMNSLQQQKAVWSGTNHVSNSMAVLGSNKVQKTAERLRMEAAERNRQARLRAIMEATAKANAGMHWHMALANINGAFFKVVRLLVCM